MVALLWASGPSIGQSWCLFAVHQQVQQVIQQGQDALGLLSVVSAVQCQHGQAGADVVLCQQHSSGEVRSRGSVGESRHQMVATTFRVATGTPEPTEENGCIV